MNGKGQAIQHIIHLTLSLCPTFSKEARMRQPLLRVSGIKRRQKIEIIILDNNYTPHIYPH